MCALKQYGFMTFTVKSNSAFFTFYMEMFITLHFRVRQEVNLDPRTNTEETLPKYPCLQALDSHVMEQKRD